MDAAALIFARRLVAVAVLSLATVPLLSAQAASTAQAASAPSVTAANDNLWDLSARSPRASGASRQQWMVAVLRRNPQAFVGGNIHRLRVGVPLQLPAAAEVAAEDARAAVSLIDVHRTAWAEGREVAALAASGAPAPAPAREAGGAAVPQASASAAPSAPAVPAARPPAAVPAASAVTATPTGASAAQPSAATSAPQTDAPQTAPGPAASTAPEPAPAAPERPGKSWWLLALLLAGGAGGYLWWRQGRARARQRFEESVISSFFDENGERRVSRPRIVDVSQAAAEMARTVETLQSAEQVVRGQGASAPAAVPAATHEREGALKLALARASLELGQTARARALLQAVRREGSTAAQLEADTLLASLPAA